MKHRNKNGYEDEKTEEDTQSPVFKPKRKQRRFDLLGHRLIFPRSRGLEIRHYPGVRTPALLRLAPTRSGPALVHFECDFRGVRPEVFFVDSTILGDDKSHDA